MTFIVSHEAATAAAGGGSVAGSVCIEYTCASTSLDDLEQGGEDATTLLLLQSAEGFSGLVSSGTELRFHCDARFVTIDSIKVWTSNRKRSLRIASSSLSSSSSASSDCCVTLADDGCGSAVGSSVELVAAFRTKVRDGATDPHGLYTCGGGRLATHFEVDHARGACPCPDHPMLRLRWNVTVQHPEKYLCFGNGPVASVKPCGGSGGGGMAQTVFGEVGPSLPAYCIGLFLAPSSSMIVTPVPKLMGCRVVVPVNSAFPTDVVVSSLQVALPILKSYFPMSSGGEDDEQEIVEGDEPLLLPFASKLDVVVVPRMPIGGMEHHGLIFINELVGTKGTRAKQTIDITELVIHEVAHHWIGNAVGMPFAIKEGICQIVEQCVGDVVLGKAMRKYSVSAELAAASLSVEHGQELTGHTYQRALNFMMHHASTMGFSGFCKSLHRLLKLNWGGYITEAQFITGLEG